MGSVCSTLNNTLRQTQDVGLLVAQDTVHPPVDSKGSQAEGLKLDEASSILLVVQAAVVLEGGNLLVVQAVWGLSANHADISLHHHLTVCSIS